MLLTQVKWSILLFHIIIQVRGSKCVDGCGPHANQNLSTNKQCHIQSMLTVFLLTWTCLRPLPPTAICNGAETLPTPCGIQLLQLIRWRDEVREGKKCSTHSNDHSPYGKPAWPPAPSTKVADEYNNEETAYVKAADQQTRFWTTKTVALFCNKHRNTHISVLWQGSEPHCSAGVSKTICTVPV